MAKLSYSMVMERYDALDRKDAELRRFYTPEPPLEPDDEALPSLLDADTSQALEKVGANPNNSSLTNFGMGFQASPFDTKGKRQICKNGTMVKHRFADVLELPVQGEESSSDEEEEDFPATQRALSRLSMPESGYASTRGSGFGAAAVVARAHTPDSAALEKQIVDKMNRDLERRTDALRKSLEERAGAELSGGPGQEPALFDQIADPTAKIQPTEVQVETVNTARAAAQKNAEALSGRRSQLQRSLTAESARVNSSRASAGGGSQRGDASDGASQVSGSQSAQPERVFEQSTPAWRLSIKSPGRARADLGGSQTPNTFASQVDSSTTGLNDTQSRLLKSRDSVGSRRSSHSRDGGRDSATLEEPLRPGAPPRQPKPKGKAAEALLARKKLLVLCDLPKRGDNRPGYHMLSTERYQGEMKVMWDKKQRKQKKERERRRQAALMAAEARGEHPQGVAQNIRPSSADPLTYNLRIQLPEHLGFPAHSRDYAFELRVTDVTAAGKPSHTWPLLTLGAERYLHFQGDISSDRTVLAPVTALPWINEAVLAANTSSSRPGQTQTGVIARHLSEHGLRVEVWPWKYVPEDGRTGEEAVLVSMKKAIDICVYYTLGREAKVRRLAYKDQIWETSPPPPGQQFDSAMIPPSDIVQSCCAGATTMISVDAKTDGSSQGDTMPAVKRVGRRAAPGKRLKSILKGGGHSATVDGVEKFMQVSQLEGGVGGVPEASSTVLQRKSALSAQEKANARRLIHSPERTVPTIQSEGTESMMARTAEMMGEAPSHPREITRPSFEMTRDMDFNDSARQMARRMSDFVPVPPIGYELQKTMDMGVNVGAVDLENRTGTPELSQTS